MLNRWLTGWLLIVSAALAGCEDTPPPPVAGGNPPVTTDAERADASADTSVTERTPAEAGVGRQGRSLDDVEGVGNVVAQPAKSLFAARERLVFEVQIPQALDLFKATNGRGPQTHEEFMSQIVQANQIRLPDLPEGQRYVYDPQQEQLMVERLR